MNASAPLVSVIIPTYNRARLIEGSIRSVFAQDYPNIEVLVVDVGSVDDTEKVMAGIRDERLRYLKQEKNRGAPAARNVGIREARGELLAFLDSDDAWEPTKLSRQVEVMVKGSEETALVYTGMRKVNERGETRGFKRPSKRGYIYHDLLVDNVVGSTSTALVRASAAKEVGGFDESLRSRQDMDLWLRLSKNHKVDFVDAPLVIYSVHNDRISSNYDSKIQGCETVLAKYYQDIEKDPSALAAHYYLLGTLHQKKGDVKNARRYFRLSLRSRLSTKALIRHMVSSIHHTRS